MENFEKVLLLAVTFSTLSLNAMAQSRVSGRVGGDGENKVLPFANILLLQAMDSSLVKGTVSDEEGQYIFEGIKNGRYLIKALLLGYKPGFSASFVIADDGHPVEPIELNQDDMIMNEVVVEGKKPLYEQQLDRLIVNVQSSITAAGSTILEVLERSPGISVDRQNNVLSMYGKGGVQVMINGKPSRLPSAAVIQMLEGMNAANLDKIEFITSPSARYDAEGSAGLLNIVLMKNMEYGTNGSVSVTAGFGWYGKSGANLTLNHRREKLNIYGDYALAHNHSWYELGNIRKVINQKVSTETSSIGSNINRQTTHTPRIGFDYRISPSTTIGGVISGFYNKPFLETINTISIKENDIKSTNVGMNSIETNLWQHGMGNLFARHSFSGNQEVSLDVDYLLYRNSSPATYEIFYQFRETGEVRNENIKVEKSSGIKSWIAKADYILHLTDNSRLEFGAKGSFTWLDNEVAVDWRLKEGWYTDPHLSQKIDMKENIFAGYTHLFLQMKSKITMQAGLRWEHTFTNINSPQQKNLVLRRYHQLFPNLAFSKELNSNNNLQFSYNRRISRPTFNDLAPFVSFKDPYSFWSGNTALMPTITDALQANYQFKKRYLLSFQAGFNKNAVTWLVTLDPETNKQNVFIANTDRTNNYSINLTIPISVNSWWEMENTLASIWQQNSTLYNGIDLYINGRIARINTTQNFKLPYNLNLEVSAFYKSRAVYGIFRQSSTGSLNMGIQRNLKNNWGNLNLNISDVFWTNRFKIRLAYPTVNLDQVFYHTPEPRVIKLTYRRTFGNQKIKEASKRKTGSEDERNRVK